MSTDPLEPRPPALPPEPGSPLRGQRSIAGLVPFGLGQDKPHELRDALSALWGSRGRSGDALSLLTRGVCDRCALGPRGLHDDVVEGVHVCSLRLRELGLYTRDSAAPADLLDIERLRAADEATLRELGRISYPYIYRSGNRGFRRASWDDALQLIGGLAPLAGDRIGFIAAARGLSDESSYTLAKAARLLGTNNVDRGTRPGSSAAHASLRDALGVGAATCSLSDLIGADLLLVLGSTIIQDQPMMARYLLAAKDRGARVIVVSPTLEPGLSSSWVLGDASSALFGSCLMDDFIKVSVGGEASFLNGVLKALDEREATDAAFIARATAGWEARQAQLRATTWEALERASGSSRREMSWVCDVLLRARSCVSLLETSGPDASAGARAAAALIDLHLSRGLIGRPKCGIIPIDPDAGTAGALACGVGPESLPGAARWSEARAAELAEAWGAAVPVTPGLSAEEMLAAAERGEQDLLVVAGDALSAIAPDEARLAEQLRGVRLRVHQDVQLSRAALMEPGEHIVLLPAQTRYEQRGGGLTTSMERRVRFSPEILEAPTPGECRPAWEIPCLIAMALRPGLANQLTYSDAAEIRAEMARIIPVYEGAERLGRAGDWIQWGGPQLYGEGVFAQMPDERARFSAAVPSDPGRAA